jgi:hypothetical protein
LLYPQLLFLSIDICSDEKYLFTQACMENNATMMAIILQLGGKEKIYLTHNCVICISNLVEHDLAEHGNHDNANTLLNELSREQIFD